MFKAVLANLLFGISRTSVANKVNHFVSEPKSTKQRSQVEEALTNKGPQREVRTAAKKRADPTKVIQKEGGDGGEERRREKRRGEISLAPKWTCPGLAGAGPCIGHKRSHCTRQWRGVAGGSSSVSSFG